MPTLSAELACGVIALFCSVILPAMVALKTLRSVPKDQEPILRAEYDLRDKYREEQVHELKAQLQELKGRVAENEDDFKDRLDALVTTLNGLRVDIAGIASAIRHHFGEGK